MPFNQTRPREYPGTPVMDTVDVMMEVHQIDAVDDDSSMFVVHVEVSGPGSCTAHGRDLASTLWQHVIAGCEGAGGFLRTELIVVLDVVQPGLPRDTRVHLCPSTSGSRQPRVGMSGMSLLASGGGWSESRHASDECAKMPDRGKWCNRLPVNVIDVAEEGYFQDATRVTFPVPGTAGGSKTVIAKRSSFLNPSVLKLSLHPVFSRYFDDFIVVKVECKEQETPYYDLGTRTFHARVVASDIDARSPYEECFSLILEIL